MRRRLYFLLPDTTSARQVVDDLLLARVEERHMHVLARDDIPLEGLHEASILQKSDIVHGAEAGLVVGAIAGVVAGLVVLAFPPADTPLRLVTLLLTTMLGAGFGAWVSSMIASSIPNSRLKAFEHAIADGQILLMVDVPASRVREIRELVSRRHPEASGGTQDPTIPAFP
ncbi:DUF1269 domain-containing protein [Thiobacter aerophilum]|uniref:DUF1269 domain-containing protein n=1 Tax=Thiobacter aerophilum TaxID=3121275 RepID=A0ABV0EFQ1_9BURK